MSVPASAISVATTDPAGQDRPYKGAMTLTPTGDLGTVLGIWAHPDDEAYLSAGLMGALRDAGRRVVVATATYGELGTPDPLRFPPDKLAAIRRDELHTSLTLVGVHEHHWLGYADGSCADIPPADGADSVAKLISEIQPDTILTFGPEGMTGHPDHRTVSAWTRAAWLATGARGRLLYATLTPAFHARWGTLNDRIGLWSYGNPPVTPDEDLAVRVTFTGAELDRKIAALRSHASQVDGLVAEVGEQTFHRWWSTEAFVPSN
jgi:LmbE family N-acetylglucosaminyl deacetylase